MDIEEIKKTTHTAFQKALDEFEEQEGRCLTREEELVVSSFFAKGIMLGCSVRDQQNAKSINECLKIVQQTIQKNLEPGR